MADPYNSREGVKEEVKKEEKKNNTLFFTKNLCKN